MKLSNRYKIVIIVNICFIGAVSFGQSVFIYKTSEFGLKLATNQAACIDYDNDGWVDIYTSGTLWKNNKGNSFSKVFEKGSNAIWADFNNNGYSDLFCYSTQRLFCND